MTRQRGGLGNVDYGSRVLLVIKIKTIKICIQFMKIRKINSNISSMNYYFYYIINKFELTRIL